MTTTERLSAAFDNYFMGTNSKVSHLEEALHQGIIAPGERLLGLFDGIFFDPNGQRVGGLALNDYLIVTDQRLTLWARDQFKDIVDAFPLSHAFVIGSKPKDTLHSTLVLGLNLPDVPVSELELEDKLEITFDFVPSADIKLIADLVTVMGSLHRDMVIGGAGEADIVKAASILYEQVFIGKSTKTAPSAAPEDTDDYFNAPQKIQHYTIVEDEREAEAQMTPLSRLDSLDSFAPPAARPQPIPPNAERHYGAGRTASAGRTTTHTSGPLYHNESRLFPPGSSVPPSDVPEEITWTYAEGLNPGQPPVRPASSRPIGTGNEQRRFNFGGATDRSTPPGVRLREDLNSEGFYTIARSARSAWDGLDKLRHEAESKVGILPTLKALRESGMNVKEMTDLLKAANDLLDTLGSNPAAREVAMAFINRAVGSKTAAPAEQVEKPTSTRVKLKPSAKKPPQVEEVGAVGIADDVDMPVDLTQKMKAERAATPPVAEAATPSVGEKLPRHRVAIRSRKSAESETGDEAELVIPFEPVGALITEPAEELPINNC